jgi:predicted RND superfamily exporter protein
MKLLQLKGDSNNEEILEYLKLRHTSYFATNKLSEPQMLRLIEQLKKKIESGANYSKESPSILSKQNNLSTNKFGFKPNSPQGTGLANSSISPKNLTLNSNSKKLPLLPLNISQKPVEIKKWKTPNPPAEDEYEEEGFEEDFEEEIIEDDEDISETTKKQLSESRNNSQEKMKINSGRKEKDEGIYSKINFNEMHLNKLSDKEVQAVKEKMDIDFNKKIIKPGDQNFVYDKREEFDPQSSNEWDEEILDDF